MPNDRTATEHSSDSIPAAPLVFDTRTLGPAIGAHEDAHRAGAGRPRRRAGRRPRGRRPRARGPARGRDRGRAGHRDGDRAAGRRVRAVPGASSPRRRRCGFRSCSPTTTRTATRTSDGYLLDGDLLDLEPALRDALVLELPLSPLCSQDAAQGLCVRVRGQAGGRGPPGHAARAARHDGRRWSDPAGRRGRMTGRRDRRRSAEVAVPKRQMSRSNTRSRRAQWKATAPQLVSCPQCRDPKLPHTACPTCGTYNRRQVINPS